MQLKRTTRDSIELIKDKLSKLGNALCGDMHVGSAQAILAGPEGIHPKDTTVSAALERWNAALAVRLVLCDSLALRVKGASDIRELVDEVCTTLLLEL